MLLKITTTHQPATDLGYLLGKHPDRIHERETPFGRAQVIFPEATPTRCSAALIVELDPVSLVRGSRGSGQGVLSQYVNDRPYTTSSFMSVALSRMYASALGGRCRDKPELEGQKIPLEAHLPVVRCRAGAEMVQRCFEPLGYTVTIKSIVLDEQFPQWGESGYFDLTLNATITLSDLLTHLYVLLPALDGDKHYFVADDEVQKLVDKGQSWLPEHPERDWILGRYLRRQRSLVGKALEQLLEDSPDLLALEDERDAQECAQLRTQTQQSEQDGQQAPKTTDEATDKKMSLNQQRLLAAFEVVRKSGARSVVDMGCGEGRLLAYFLKERQFERILGMDVSMMSLDYAAERLKLERMPPLKSQRIELVQGSLTYRDDRLKGFDAACVVEVIEHMEPERLPALERSVFEFAQPNLVVVTTPNAEYNALYEGLEAGAMRHGDHRFEWTRQEFQDWSHNICERFGYEVEFLPVGEVDERVGTSTQMGVFKK